MGKIHCGNNLDVMAGMKAESVDLVLTDPPYVINYQSHRRNAKHGKIANDDKFDFRFLDHAYRLLKPDSVMVLFTRWDVWSKWEAAIIEAGFTIKNMIVWNKNNHGSGDIHGSLAPKHELAFFAVKGKFKLIAKRDSDVWDCPKTNSDLHSTEKPVPLMARAIKNFTRPGEVVLDMFCGSGAAMVASRDLGRQYIGIDIDPVNVQITTNRLDQQVLIIPETTGG